MRLQKGGRPPKKLEFGRDLPPNIGPLFPNGDIISIQLIYSEAIKFISADTNKDLELFIKNTVLDVASSNEGIDMAQLEVNIRKIKHDVQILNVKYSHNEGSKLTDEIVIQIRKNIDEYLKDKDMIEEVGRD